MNTGSAIQTNVLPSNIAKQDPLPENLNRIRESVGQNCSKEALQKGLDDLLNIINSSKNFAELLSPYLHAKPFLDMDNELFNCASALINALPVVPSDPNTNLDAATKSIIVHDTVYVDRIVNPPAPIPQYLYNQKIIYLATASGSVILILLLLLFKYIKSSKIFKQLYEKIHDKILDEIADRLLVAAGIKEDEKFKEKIKKLIELNEKRKKGDLKLDQYVLLVDNLLD